MNINKAKVSVLKKLDSLAKKLIVIISHFLKSDKSSLSGPN